MTEGTDQGQIRTLRVLVVSQYFRPEVFRVNDLVDWLVARGHEVVVLTGLPNYPGGRFFSGYSIRGPWTQRATNLTIIRVPLIPRGTGSGIRLVLNYLSFALVASIVGPLRCSGKFDAIFVHEPSPVTVGIPAVLLRALKRTSLLFWVLDLWPDSLEATGAIRSVPILRAVDRLTGWIYRRCDRILMQSRRFAPRIERHGISARRLLYFPNWAEPAIAGRDGVDATVPPVALPEGFRIVYAGNIGAAQDFPTVLEAAERLADRRDIHWILVGAGRAADWVASEVTRRRLNATVHLPGAFPPECMPALFREADALLVSLRPEPIFALTIPAKVQAYLVAGRAIIAMLDGEGARIVAESGAGLTCEAGDASALASRVLELCALGPHERAEMGARGRAYSRKHFDRDLLMRRLERWLAGDDLPGIT